LGILVIDSEEREREGGRSKLIAICPSNFSEVGLGLIPVRIKIVYDGRSIK